MMETLPLKRQLTALLREQLESDLVRAEQAQLETQRGATHAESRPENDKDTRALESTYLARGLAQRVNELRGSIARVKVFERQELADRDTVSLSALVTVRGDQGPRRYFVAPTGGGVHATIDGERIGIITLSSALGAALLGKEVGDEATVTGRHLEITEVL